MADSRTMAKHRNNLSSKPVLARMGSAGTRDRVCHNFRLGRFLTTAAGPEQPSTRRIGWRGSQPASRRMPEGWRYSAVVTLARIALAGVVVGHIACARETPLMRS